MASGGQKVAAYWMAKFDFVERGKKKKKAEVEESPLGG